MPIFVSLRLANSSINSDKQTNKQTKNPSVLIYKIKNYPILSNAKATAEVEYKVSGTLSAEHTDERTVHSRHLSNSRRLHVATELTENLHFYLFL